MAWEESDSGAPRYRRTRKVVTAAAVLVAAFGTGTAVAQATASDNGQLRACDARTNGGERTGEVDAYGSDSCIVIRGKAPDVSATLYLAGNAIVGYNNDACSWVNAGAVKTLNYIELDDGQLMAFVVMPGEAGHVTGQTKKGQSIDAIATATADGRESYFAVPVDDVIDLSSLTSEGLAISEPQKATSDCGAREVLLP